MGQPTGKPPLILVVPPIGDQAHAWLARGADDVVGLAGPETMRHALQRVLDQRAGHARVGATLTRLGDERALTDALFESHPHALALLRDQTLLRGNRRFDQLIGVEDSRARELRWQSWLDLASRQTVATLERDSRATLQLGTRSGARHRVRVEPLGSGEHASLLLAIEPRPLSTRVEKPVLTDPATGLLVRDALVERFDEILARARAARPLSSRRYTAMRVSLSSSPDNTSGDGIGRTFEDLLVLRAAEALRNRFRGTALLGRAGRSSLLVVRRGRQGEAARDLAGRVRDTLGSLGGFIDEPAAVRIDTLTLPVNAVSARVAVERLERRKSVAESS